MVMDRQLRQLPSPSWMVPSYLRSLQGTAIHWTSAMDAGSETLPRGEPSVSICPVEMTEGPKIRGRMVGAENLSKFWLIFETTKIISFVLQILVCCK